MYRRLILWVIFLLVLCVPLKYIYRYIEVWQTQFGIIQPNVLIITIDTCRADSLGSYGNPGIYTACLDRLSQNAIQFQRAYAPIPTTGPSHATLFTGLLPARHRVFRNAMPYRRSNKTMATIFKDLGYRTAAFVSGYSLVSRVSGLGKGFELYDDGWSETQLERPGSNTVKAYETWMNDIGQSRFFAWVHLFDMHSPYAPSDLYSGMMANVSNNTSAAYSNDQIDRYDSNVQRALEKKDFKVLVKDPTCGETDPETLQRNQAQYWAELCYVDRCIERILRTLELDNRRNRTLVIITADHGEGFDHDYYFGHGDRLWESAISVPLLIQYPLTRNVRRLCHETGTLQDIFPSVLSIAQLNLPVGKMDGENLEPVMRNGFYKEFRTGFTVAPPLPRKGLSEGLIISVYDPEFKLIWNDARQTGELYHISEDPAERVDVSADYPGVMRRLTQRLKAHRVKARYPEVPRLQPSEISEKEKLKQLGYIWD